MEYIPHNTKVFYPVTSWDMQWQLFLTSFAEFDHIELSHLILENSED